MSDLHQVAGLHQAAEFAHDAHMLASVALLCIELPIVVDKVEHILNAHNVGMGFVLCLIFIDQALGVSGGLATLSRRRNAGDTIDTTGAICKRVAYSSMMCARRKKATESR